MRADQQQSRLPDLTAQRLAACEALTAAESWRFAQDGAGLVSPEQAAYELLAAWAGFRRLDRARFAPNLRQRCTEVQRLVDEQANELLQASLKHHPLKQVKVHLAALRRGWELVEEHAFVPPDAPPAEPPEDERDADGWVAPNEVWLEQEKLNRGTVHLLVEVDRAGLWCAAAEDVCQVRRGLGRQMGLVMDRLAIVDDVLLDQPDLLIPAAGWASLVVAGLRSDLSADLLPAYAATANRLRVLADLQERREAAPMREQQRAANRRGRREVRERVAAALTLALLLRAGRRTSAGAGTADEALKTGDLPGTFWWAAPDASAYARCVPAEGATQDQPLRITFVTPDNELASLDGQAVSLGRLPSVIQGSAAAFPRDVLRALGDQEAALWVKGERWNLLPEHDGLRPPRITPKR